MDPSQFVVPVLGVAAAAAVTFYAVSFWQLSEQSFEKLAEMDLDKPKLRSSLSTKEVRKLRKANKEKKKPADGQ